jgi:hypothetical protein
MEKDRKAVELLEEAVVAREQSPKTCGAEVKGPIRTPYWPKWKCYQFDKLYLAEAVALSCDIEPDSLGMATEDCSYDGYFDEFNLRIEIAQDVAGDAFEADRVPERNGGERIRVRLGRFDLWALKMQGMSPEIWKNLPEKFVALAAEKPARKWP